MNHDIQYWGCLICSQVWLAAPGSNAEDIAFAAVWLIFAVVIGALSVRERRTR